jgi:hypothetical protein
MLVETMRDTLQHWLAITGEALSGVLRPNRNFSPAFRLILERYQRLLRGGQVQEILQEVWQRLKAILDNQGNSG